MSNNARFLIACKNCMASAARTGDGAQWIRNYEQARRVASELIAA